MEDPIPFIGCQNKQAVLLIAQFIVFPAGRIQVARAATTVIIMSTVRGESATFFAGILNWL